MRERDTGQKKKKNLHSNYKVHTKKFNETNYIFSMQLKTCIDYWLLQSNFKSKIKCTKIRKSLPQGYLLHGLLRCLYHQKFQKIYLNK